ncbi:unnamed protein product [Phytophthora fragariaefolia]|uniref:Unnamed protein product n=1 Tax=Phytophthora fragariaefolia TaxID=1490495 RepID=A0A9W6XAJ7_9STRA|nr:unnamed protein product [Phytophthora fragariaefolia]
MSCSGRLDYEQLWREGQIRNKTRYYDASDIDEGITNADTENDAPNPRERERGPPLSGSGTTPREGKESKSILDESRVITVTVELDNAIGIDIDDRTKRIPGRCRVGTMTDQEKTRRHGAVTMTDQEKIQQRGDAADNTDNTVPESLCCRNEEYRIID